MLSRIYTPRDQRESGFTLIELLVVVAIIGILAAIAIPVFLNQRNTARNASVESDLRNVATVLETAYTQNGVYPAAGVDLTTAPYGAAISQGNGISVTNNTSSYAIVGCNAESQEVYVYDSSQGGFVTPTTQTCPSAGIVVVAGS
jgi:type IV pilus assembly protein PilA